MPLRVIEILAEEPAVATLRATAEQHEAIDVVEWECMPDPETQGPRPHRHAVRILAETGSQKLLDALHACLRGHERWRMLILPVEGVIPVIDETKEETQKAELGKKARSAAPREELYADVSKGVQLDATYLLLVLLSTVVAAIGLLEDNVAVIIGAMVIAPLLSPNLALSLGVALGDLGLIGRALRTGATGLALALGVSLLAGLALPQVPAGRELLSRADVGYDSIALALASGAAAVLSLTTGLSSALVGVMVAVALLPPTAAAGLFLGMGKTYLAMGAFVLLAVNIVCVNIAAQLVLLAQGVTPRTWVERQGARRLHRLTLLVWVLLLGVLALLIAFAGPYWSVAP